MICRVFVIMVNIYFFIVTYFCWNRLTNNSLIFFFFIDMIFSTPSLSFVAIIRVEAQRFFYYFIIPTPSEFLMTQRIEYYDAKRAKGTTKTDY